MPITLAQPEPFSPQISQAVGETQQLSHDLPAIASIYERNAALQAQQAGQAQQLHAQAVAQQNQIGEQRDALAAHAQAQAQMFAAGRMPSERDAFQSQAEMAQQNNRAQNAAWLSQQQLSQQEQASLRQRQEAVGWVNQQLEAGNMTPDEADSYVGKLRTGIDRDKQRQERAQAQMLEERKKQMVDQAAFMASVTNEDAAVRAKAIDSRIVKRTNPYTGEDEEYFIGHDGDLKKVPYEKAQKEPSDRDREAEAVRQAEHKVVEASMKRFADYRLQAEKEIDRRASARDKDGKFIEPRFQDTDQLDTHYNGGQKMTYREAQTEALARSLAGGAATAEEYAQKSLGSHRTTFGRGQAATGPAPGGPGGGSSTPQPTPAEQKFVADNKPFKAESFDKEATPTQKEAVAGWNAIGKNVEAYTQDPQQLRAYRDNAAWAVRAFATYGSEPAMPPQVLARYKQIQQAMLPFLNPPKRPGAPVADERPASERFVTGPKF